MCEMLPLLWGNKVNFTINPLQLAYFTAQETPILWGAGALFRSMKGLLRSLASRIGRRQVNGSAGPSDHTSVAAGGQPDTRLESTH